MAIAHVCLHCGTTLTRVRPHRDPHYSLLLVVCPDCGQAWVRSRHPIQHRWRAYLRAQRSVGTLVLQVCLLGGLATATVASIGWLDFKMVRMSYEALLQRTRAALVFMGVVLPLSVGVWLTAGLSHWRRWVAWVAWTTLIAFLLSIEPILQPLLVKFKAFCGLAVIPTPVEVDWWVHKLAILGGIMLIATAGIVFGRGLRAAHGRHRRHRWRQRRVRMRATRIAA